MSQYFCIENCTVTSAGSGINDAGIRVENASHGIIRNNTCYMNGNYGIFLGKEYQDPFSYSYSYSYYNGLCYDNLLDGNDCKQNTIGINFQQAYLCTAKNNNCHENKQDGLKIELSTSLTIKENNCSLNSYYGIHVYESDVIVISDNVISWNLSGIYLYFARQSSVTDNTCNFNTEFGIHLLWSRNNLISGNNAENNVKGPCFEENCESNSIYNNSFIYVSQPWLTLSIIAVIVLVTFVIIRIKLGGPEFARNLKLFKDKISPYKAKVSHKYRQIKARLQTKWELARKHRAEKHAREAEISRQQMEEALKREAEMTLQSRNEEGRIAHQQAETARQRMEEKEKVARQQAEIAHKRLEAEERRIQQTTSQIERVVLELAPQFPKLQVEEIAEKCGVSEETLIINTLKQMIARKLIDATYFKSTKSVAFQQHILEKPFASEATSFSKQHADVRRQYEYVGGKVRLKVKIMNTGKTGLLRVTCMLIIPPSFKLLRVEPSDYSADGPAVKIQDLLPGEEKSIAYVLEPMICGKERFSGTVSGLDAEGGPISAPIAPLEVEVRCPLFATPEEANLPIVKNLALELPVKSERVFYLPKTLAPNMAFELVKAAISERDVRFVGSVAAADRKEGDDFDESAWFYGTTKVEKRRYVLSAAVSEKDRVIRLATACDDEAGCTGFLAEAGAAVRRELVRRGAFETEEDVIELVCEKCGATLPSAPTMDHDVRCPDCGWTWYVKDFFH